VCAYDSVYAKTHVMDHVRTEEHVLGCHGIICGDANWLMAQFSGLASLVMDFFKRPNSCFLLCEIFCHILIFWIINDAIFNFGGY